MSNVTFKAQTSRTRHCVLLKSSGIPAGKRGPFNASSSKTVLQKPRCNCLCFFHSTSKFTSNNLLDSHLSNPLFRQRFLDMLTSKQKRSKNSQFVFAFQVVHNKLNVFVHRGLNESQKVQCL